MRTCDWCDGAGGNDDDGECLCCDGCGYLDDDAMDSLSLDDLEERSGDEPPDPTVPNNHYWV